MVGVSASAGPSLVASTMACGVAASPSNVLWARSRVPARGQHNALNPTPNTPHPAVRCYPNPVSWGQAASSSPSQAFSHSFGYSHSLIGHSIPGGAAGRPQRLILHTTHSSNEWTDSCTPSPSCGPYHQACHPVVDPAPQPAQPQQHSFSHMARLRISVRL